MCVCDVTRAALPCGTFLVFLLSADSSFNVPVLSFPFMTTFPIFPYFLSNFPHPVLFSPPQLLLISSSCIVPFSYPCTPLPPVSSPLHHLFPPVSWFLLVLSRQLLSRTTSRSYCSLWWSGRSMTPPSAASQDQSPSPGRVRLISGLSGLVLAGRGRAARGVWVVDACCLGHSAGAEGGL